jgi:hypothetical protein
MYNLEKNESELSSLLRFLKNTMAETLCHSGFGAFGHEVIRQLREHFLEQTD